MFQLSVLPRFGFSRHTAIILLSLPFAAACGPSDASSTSNGGSAGSGIETVPTVLSNIPLQDVTGVPVNGYIRAIFSEEMDAADITTATFTLTSGATTIPGTVIYTNATATFWPAAQLASNTKFVATINEGATSVRGVPLAMKHSWSFTTGENKVMGQSVDLGAAGNYVILSKSGISTVPMSTITGDLGVSPAAATYITGFSLIADATNAFSTSMQVSGKVYAANYAVPSPSSLTTAVDDMQFAFTSAAARAPDVIDLGAGNIGGMTLDAGVYKWGTGLLIPTEVALQGTATDVWIFQIAKDLTVADAARITLAGGALAKNIFWQVSGAVSVGTTAQFEGVVLSKTAIILDTGASLNGRLLAQTAVVLSGNTIVEPTE
ncbi:MAG TPA: ice-binding family protein [Polyangium sp.]|nr:ice-binding family protein [Polyangium sp.]